MLRPHALNFNASKGSRKNTSNVFHFLFHFFPSSVLVSESCFQIKTSKCISKVEKGGQGQGRGHLIYYLFTLELQGILMIYQAINPVVGTILIICLHEKSDKYIILSLHCRFYMSLPQVVGVFLLFCKHHWGAEHPYQGRGHNNYSFLK